MEIEQFLSEMREEINDKLSDGGTYSETVFTEFAMRHMDEIGMTGDAQVCHFERKLGASTLRVSGFSVSDEGDRLDMFVSIYKGVSVITPISNDEIRKAGEHCLQFISQSVSGKLPERLAETEDAFGLACCIQSGFTAYDQIRIFVLTDCVASNFKDLVKTVDGRDIRIEVMDLGRLYRHLASGRPREEIVVSFGDWAGGPIPCVYVPNVSESEAEFDIVLTAIPAEALRRAYEKYGERLLESNVRAFLSATGKVNKGIRDTIKSRPGRFLAYNNGVVIVTDEANVVRMPDGGTGLESLRGMQIVNGGQTTASIYFARKKEPTLDLSMIRVPAKVVILARHAGTGEEDALVSDISKFANSQNVVKQSDFTANDPWHIKMERLSRDTVCLDGKTQWFYERTIGSYQTMLEFTKKPGKRISQIVAKERRIPKTEAARYLQAWGGRPHKAALGTQKCYLDFISNGPRASEPQSNDFKELVALAILFKRTQAIARARLKASQGYTATYAVARINHEFGSRFRLERIWERQALSRELEAMINSWVVEIDRAFHDVANGRLLSEVAKKEDCWTKVKACAMPLPSERVPEIS